MAQLKKTKHLVEIKKEGGFTFYRPKFKRDWFVSGPDICRIFGVKNPNVRSSQVWKRYEEHLSRNSCVIEIPTKTAKTSKKGISQKDTPFDTKNTQKGTTPLISTFDTKNTQKVRCYNRSGAWFFTSKLNTKSSDCMISCLFDSFDIIMRYKEPKPLEWQQTREGGKQQRKCLTDAIQVFVEYATSQGSGNADTYYIHFTKKISKLLGLESRTRDELSSKELGALAIAEEMVAEYILNCMDIGIPYKQAFKTSDPIVCNVKTVLDFKHVPELSF